MGVQVVGHGAVQQVGGRYGHQSGSAVRAHGRQAAGCFVAESVGEVAVHCVAAIGRAEDSIRFGGGVAGSADPAVLNGATAAVGHAAAAERARNAQVVHTTAKFAEERAAETADGMAVAVQRTGEASAIGAGDRRPRTARTGVAVQVELQTLAVVYVGVEGAVVAHVEELVQLVYVVEIDLRVAAYLGVVYVEEVFVGQHVGQVMVVGHGDAHGVRIGLAQIALGVEGHVVAVLVPVERRYAVDVLLSVLVAVGVALALEDFPAAAYHGDGAVVIVDGGTEVADGLAWHDDALGL